MTSIPVSETITAVATLVAAIGSLIAAIRSTRASHRVGVKLNQATDESLIFSTQLKHVAEMQRSQGKQIGEIRKDLTAMHHDVSSLITKQILG